MQLLRFFFFLCLLTGSCICAGQNTGQVPESVMPVFRQVSYPFLPSITSDNFYFTSDGLMWLSTANGLTSFDGTSVLNHSSIQQASEFEINRIFAFAEDRYHNLYLGSRRGVYYYDRKNKAYSLIEYIYTNSGKAEPTAITCLYIDSNDIVYIGTGSRGLLIYDPGTKKIEHLNLNDTKADNWENRFDNTVKCIVPHSTDKNKLWLGTFNGIYLFDKKTKTLKKNFKVLNPSMSFDGAVRPFYDVQRMEILNDSIIWFNSWSGGFCEYNSKTGNVQVYFKKEIEGLGANFSMATITSFVLFSKNYFFIGAGSNKSCLFEIDSKKIRPVNITGLINSFDRVEFVTKDRQNNMWLLRNGLLYTTIPLYGRIKTTDISRKSVPGIHANELRGIYYDTAAHKYYGAVRFSSGVHVFDSSFQQLEIIPTPLYINSYTYKETCTDKITKDGSGRLWVTGHETYIKLPGMKKFDYIRNVLPTLSWIEKKGEFNSLVTTKTGDVLIRGVDANVYIINHKTLQTDTAKIQKFNYNGKYFISLSPLLYDSVRSLIYYSNDYGVSQYNLVSKEIKKLNADEFLGYDQKGLPFVKIAIDHSGYLWAMRVNGGFRILDPVTLKCIDSFSIGSRGLKAENYSNIIYGGKDFMFLQGQNGVVVYNYIKQQSFLIDNTNGLKYPTPFSILYCNKNLVLGQFDAVQHYNITLFEKVNFTLFPRVNRILSHNEIVYEKESDDSIKEVRLKYYQYNVQVSFSAPEFIFPERIEYAYQLDGFDKDWHYANYFKREVSYTRLRPGKYTFKLKAQMQGGNWDVKPVEYEILISEAWWQTDFFDWGLVLLGIGIGVLIFRLRIQSIRRKAKNDLAHEKELLELEAKALRAQMNPHFIFNCLNSIKSLIQEHQEEKSVTYLTTFSKLIRTLFNNADKKEITLFDEIETCKLYLQLEAIRFDTKFSFSVNIDDQIDLKSIYVPVLIIQPFIENAIWHGIIPKGGGGSVALSVLKNNGDIKIVVDDNGIGREASKQNRAKSNIGHQSMGVKLTQSRLQLDNLLQQRQASIETIDKVSETGKAAGTTVILRLPQEE